MSKILKIRMLSDENEDFRREYEIDQQMTLHDLHEFICGDLGYDSSSLASFFVSGHGWERGNEFTSIEVGEQDAGEIPRHMSSVTAGQIVASEINRLVYVYDMFGGKAMYLEIRGVIAPEQDSSYPAVRETIGPPPPQFDITGGEGSIFDQIMSDFTDFEGDDLYEDDF